MFLEIKNNKEVHDLTKKTQKNEEKISSFLNAGSFKFDTLLPPPIPCL